MRGPALNAIEFDALVEQTVSELPASFRERIENVAFQVEDVADRQTLELAGISHPYDLLGFYHGIPLTMRTQGYNLVTPDKISIYRIPILRQCTSAEEARALIRRVVHHEIAHYFGVDDARLKEIGAY